MAGRCGLSNVRADRGAGSAQPRAPATRCALPWALPPPWALAGAARLALATGLLLPELRAATALPRDTRARATWPCRPDLPRAIEVYDITM